MYIDLTMPVSEKMPPFPGEQGFLCESSTTVEREGWNARRIAFPSHFSTHVDAPYHMLAKGRQLEEYPPETFFGEAFVVDVRGKTTITLQDLPLPFSEPFLLFWTGQDRKASLGGAYFEGNPVVALDAAEALAKVPTLRGVGLDSFTLDNYPYLGHKALFREGILIIENLVGLERVFPHCRLVVAPLNLQDGDGAPARVFAQL